MVPRGIRVLSASSTGRVGMRKRYWALLGFGFCLIATVYVITGGPFRDYAVWQRYVFTGLVGCGIGCIIAWSDERTRVNRHNDLKRRRPWRF